MVIGAVLPSCQLPLETVVRQKGTAGGIAAQLDTAQSAWKVMQTKSPRSLSGRIARHRYDLAVAAVLKSIGSAEGTPAWGKPVSLGGEHPWRITFDAPLVNAVPRTFSLSEFSGFVLAEDVSLSGFDQVNSVEGVGVTVVLKQEDTLRVKQPFHPPEGEFLPATAVLEFSENGPGRPPEAKLRFYNPTEVSEIFIGGSSHPLARNLTAPLQLSLTNSSPKEKKPDAPMTSRSGEDGCRLFFLNRYDPAKIPVIFVHGLMCGPVIWKNEANAILSDPELRRRYQPVCFMYPSGMSVPVTAARLRELIRDARDSLDPGRKNPGFDKMVLVGHSMGGLVSRMQVIDSGDDFWKAYFTASPRKISQRIDSKTRRMLTSSLFFKREPGVSRVIFICTPHRGSELADVGLYRGILRIVLFLPRTAKKTLEELSQLPLGFVQEQLRSFQDRGLTGTENLSPAHPFFTALAKRPIEVPYDSIIATDGDLDFRNGSDRIVPYSSAHLSGAESELRVPYWHGCVERPETVKAVTKILKSH